MSTPKETVGLRLDGGPLSVLTACVATLPDGSKVNLPAGTTLREGHDDIAASLPDQARELLRGARKLVGGAIGIDADHAFRTLSAIDAFLAGQPAPPVSIGESLLAIAESAFRSYKRAGAFLPLHEGEEDNAWEAFREHLLAAEKAAHPLHVVTRGAAIVDGERVNISQGSLDGPSTPGYSALAEEALRPKPWPFSIPSVEQGGSRLGPCDAFRASADARTICGVCGFRARAHEPTFTKLAPIDEPTPPGAIITGIMSSCKCSGPLDVCAACAPGLVNRDGTFKGAVQAEDTPDPIPLDQHQAAFALRANGVPEAFIVEALTDPRRIVAAYDEQKLAPPNIEAARRTLQILRAHVAYLDLPF